MLEETFIRGQAVNELSAVSDRDVEKLALKLEQKPQPAAWR